MTLLTYTGVCCCKLGLTRAQLERLADSADTFKVSRRDLAYVLSQVGQCCVCKMHLIG